MPADYNDMTIRQLDRIIFDMMTANEDRGPVFRKICRIRNKKYRAAFGPRN